MELNKKITLFGMRGGSDGRGVVGIVNKYLASSKKTGVTVDETGWSEAIPEINKDKKYLWNYEIVNYSDSTHEETTPCVIGTFSENGENGIDGKGIVDIIELYALTEKESPAPSVFSPKIPQMTSTFRYLWNKERIIYTQGEPKETNAVIIGVYGLKGDKGDAGTSVKIKGSIKSKEELSTKDKVEGDGYLLDGDLWVYNGNSQNDINHFAGFENVGKIQGPKGEDGTDGIDGTNGIDGETFYMHIAYANVETGTDGRNQYVDFDKLNPDGKNYLGICVNKIEKPDPDLSDPHTGEPYKWSLIRGEAGVSIREVVNWYIAAADGVTPSNTVSGWSKDFASEAKKINSDMPFLWNYEEILYSDSSQNSKTSPAIIYKYTRNGIDGINGSDGISVVAVEEEYRLTDRNGSVIEDWSSQQKKISASAPFLWNRERMKFKFPDGNIGDGEWMPSENGVLIGVYGDKGEDGTSVKIQPSRELCTKVGDAYIDKETGHLMVLVSIENQKIFEDAGKIQGPAGEQAYVHIIYAKKNSEGFYDYHASDPQGRDWMGVLSDNIKDDILPQPNDRTGGKYKWSYIKGPKGDRGIPGIQGLQGEKGEQGIRGPKGEDGQSQYFHIKYSKNSNGYPMTEEPSTYIGTRVDSNPDDSKNYLDYDWHRLEGIQGPKGEQGIPGKGQDGKTSYLHIKYSDDGGKTFTSNNGEDVGSWIGQYTDFEKDDKLNVKLYTWSKIKGDDGITVGANLLDGSDFQRNLDAWNVIRMETIPSKLNVEKIPFGGMFGTDAFHFKNISRTEAFDVLQQGLNGYGKNKLLPSRWYTLSFWAKGTSVATFIYEGVVDLNEKRYADGNETPSQGDFAWTLTWDDGGGNKWTRHTFTFKTVANFNPPHNNVLFRLFNGAEVYLSAIKLEDGKEATTWCRSEKDKTGHNGKDGQDGEEVRPNLLEGSNLIRSNRAWNAFNGEVILDGGVLGTNSIRSVYNGPDDYSNVLQQEIMSGDLTKSKIIIGRWYTLSFWAKGSVLSTYVYGEKDIVSTQEPVIIDGVEMKNDKGGLYTWQLNNEWKRHTFTFKTGNNQVYGNVLFRVFKGDNAEISAVKLEEGKTATQWCLNEKDKVGAKLRMTEWQEGRRYLSGAAGEAFYDVVLFKYNEQDAGTLYLCTKTIDADSERGKNDPSSSEQKELGIWEVAQNWKFVATDLLLSKRIAAKDIVTEDITVRKLETDNPLGATVKIENGTIQVFGVNKDHPSIEFGVDDNGNAVLRYFDQNGKFLYDLGPNKINEVTSAVFIPKQLSYMCEPVDVPTGTQLQFVIQHPSATKYYEYHAGSLAQNNFDKSIWNNNKLYGQNPDLAQNSKVKDGWYTDDFGTAQQVTLSEAPSSPDILIGFWNASPSAMYYKRVIFKVVNGFIQNSTKRYVYWQ